MVSLSRNLSFKAKGDDVGLLQNSLASIGYVIDSKEKTRKIFGKTTEKAVRKFQSEYGLRISGKVDDITRAKIVKIAGADGTQGKGKPDTLLENDITKETKSNAMMKVPKSLLESEVFFKNLEDSMTKLKKEEATYINRKLNKYFQNELLLGLIGDKISVNLMKQLNRHVAKLDFPKYTDVTLLQSAKEILTDLEKTDNRLKKEILEIKEELLTSKSTSTVANEKIGVLLGLTIPLKDNQIFRADIIINKTQQYIRLAGIDNPDVIMILTSKLDFTKFPDDVISEIIQSGIINEEQGKSLKKIASMVRLTGNNLKLVALLSNETISSLADLISWEKEDWEKVIVEKEIPFPPNETIETYTENIRYNIERTYSTQILLTKVSNSDNVSTNLSLLDSVNDLLKTNDKIIESEEIAVINWRGISASKREIMKNSLYELITFSNHYKHLGIQEIINSKTMDIPKKKDIINQTINHIKTFNRINPELDLRLLNFFDKHEMANLNWQEIPLSDQARIIKQLMAYQRVVILSDQSSEHELLITKGYDSAISIGWKTEDEFVRTSGLEPGRAKMVYFKAQQQLLHTAHNFEAIREITRGEFRHIAMSNVNPSLVNDLQEIDGFDALFGTQNYCACQECMSILSPAAYFVDLMRFIDNNISKPVFLDQTSPHPEHPLYLKNRRSDLWNLQISCENTHSLIPYLNIVNEVLQSYLESAAPALGGDIFKTLSKDSQDTNISFSLPFNLPFEEIQTYIGHFGISIFDIYKILKNSEQKTWGSKLGLSEEEFKVIVTPNPTDVKFRYGDPSSFVDFRVEDFLKSTGLIREQLDELLQIKFNDDLANILIDKQIIPNELQNFPEILKNLDNQRLDFIHRYIKLLRRTKWSISELDMVLSGLKNAQLKQTGQTDTSISINRVINIAKLIHIKENLKISTEELCCMVDSLPVSLSYPNPPFKEKEKKLFERIFDIKGLFGEDPVTHTIKSSTGFHHFSFNTNNTADTDVDAKMPLLLSGLGITEGELVLLFRVLKQEIEFDPNGECDLDLDKISLLYRHVRLARALKFGSIDDFVNAMSVCFMVPPEPTFIIDSIDHIIEIIEFKNWLQSSRFNVSEISFILFGKENSSIQFSTTLETVISLIKDVQESTETDKVEEALKFRILKLLNVSPKHLERLFLWSKTEAEPAIKKAAEGNPDNVDDLEPLIKLMHEIERVMLIFSKLKFTEKTVTKITEKAEQLGITDISDLSLANLQSITAYYKILDSMIEDKQNRDTDINIGKLLNDYHADHKFSKENIVFLESIWKRNKELLESISSLIILPNTPIDAVYYLWKLSNTCQTLGINGSLLQKIGDDADFDKLCIARDTILGAFSSKYEDEKVKQEKLAPYQEIINKRKSDILCDYIIAQEKDLKFKNRNDIYSFFLLDSEMGGCARTSRIVSAISSLQLYVHRCLLNLEQSDPKLIPYIHVDPSSIPQDQWEWRKNYRVFEANRKVFLYPENYLEPDLRDNKTPLFKELEGELLQQNITKNTAEAAYRKYLSEFAELARLVISGAYYHSDSGTYYFFGRTAQEPPQYYYRMWIGNKIWTHWKKIELTINSDRVSAIIHLGRLYIFWLEKVISTTTTVESGNTTTVTKHTQYLMFSYLNEFGRWLPPQKLLFFENPYSQNNILYPVIKENNIYIFGYDRNYVSSTTVGRKIDLFKNILLEIFNPDDDDYKVIPVETRLICSQRYTIPGHGKEFFLAPYLDERNYKVHEALFDGLSQSYNDISTSDFNTGLTSLLTEFPDVYLVGYKPGDLVVKLWDQQYIIRYYAGDVNGPFNSNPGPLDPGHGVFSGNSDSNPITGGNVSSLLYSKPLVISDSARIPFINPVLISRRTMVRLGTSLHDRLGEILFTEGIEKFLSLETQREHEQPVGVTFPKRFELRGPFFDTTHIDFYGALGEYYRELYFHIPFLIAHSLNANQKFREAKWWYERIFDPTSNESPSNPPLDPPTERNWRYIEFRNVTIQKMKSILTDQSAILQYENNPFNPHAIARLRISAYQKTIVMKYVDNLLDWGDHLFAQDTLESINEASILYILAFDILGERPVKLGSCDSAMDESKNLTYQTIETYGNYQSDFLITLENWDHMNSVNTVFAENSDADSVNGTIKKIKGRPEVDYYDRATNGRKTLELSTKKWESLPLDNKNLSHLSGVTTNTILLFCIPENKDLLNYWDRVEDRLFKIRNCMNISGVRRTLALFQPPIDPMLLVRAKAAGLNLEDITSILTPPIPLYRFTYLIEKAKQFAQTVQSFGSALISALEKKDVEELTLLRSVHEREILKLTEEIKKQQLSEAQYQYEAIVKSITNVQNRVNYYQGLIEEGLTGWEFTQEVTKHVATGFKGLEGINRILAAIFYLVPQVGSPFALKFGGKELGDSTKAWAEWMSTMASVADAISASAGLQASFYRREQEWQHQLTLSQQELLQVEQQRLAADVRKSIAQNDLDIHLKNIEHAAELDEFYRNKFTNLGLYNYLSTSMFRLYREAYNLAYDMALKVEQAYKFELDESAAFIAHDNWQFDRAGLLAGERLMLQLQRMEKAYLEKNIRENEITQSFSLALLDPSALTDLKEKAKCDFRIPEIMFNLIYPGQYKRIIKAIRITMPCLTGPLVNIGAKLTLLGSKIRYKPDINEMPGVTRHGADTYITTSSAQNDTGTFEFSFRDERYLPFEGAGAVESEWSLELPSFHSFNYDTISDVIIGMSYTAKEDGDFRAQVQDQIEDDLKQLAEDEGIFRLVSLKHDFPNAFHKLLNPATEGAEQETDFVIGKNHFPYFLSKKELKLSKPVRIYLIPKGDNKIETQNLILTINGKPIDSSWTEYTKSVQEATITLAGYPDMTWKINAGVDGFDKEKLDNILILMQCKIQ
jgi:hypothetical protein